jgi:hypothetical protein
MIERAFGPMSQLCMSELNTPFMLYLQWSDTGISNT